MADKKRHHFVPVTYLEGFCDGRGRIFAFKKDPPRKLLNLRPDEIGFENYYYSQIDDNGVQDNNALEGVFSDIEGYWPDIVRSLNEHHPLNNLQAIFHDFIAMLRVRVPATRDMVELSLAAQVKAELLTLDKSGLAPPKPPELNNLAQQVAIAIDPQRSLHAMIGLSDAFNSVTSVLGFEVIHNGTGTPYITSDNPVAYFDPDIPTRKMLPYNVIPLARKIELLFPITRSMMLRGHSDLLFDFLNNGISHRTVMDGREVQRHNKAIARFGYRLVFSSDADIETIAKPYQDSAPVLNATIIPLGNGHYVHQQWIFGPRPPKLKWAAKPSGES